MEVGGFEETTTSKVVNLPHIMATFPLPNSHTQAIGPINLTSLSEINPEVNKV